MDLSEEREALLPEQQTPAQPEAPKAGWFRYIVILMLAYGFIMDYLLRINISVALEGGMVPDNCTVNDTRCWNQSQQGYILSSFFWGYGTSQLPAALFRSHCSATGIFGAGLGAAIALTIADPLLPGFWSVLWSRILIGVGQGVTFPIALTIISNWSPLPEKGLFTAMATGGQYIGGVVGNVASGALAGSDFLGGWPSVFYVYGALGILWGIMWFALITDSPVHSRWASDGEKEYLAVSSVPQRPFRLSEVPWRKILTNRAVISCITIHSCNGYGYFMLLTDLPKFLKEVLDYDIQESGAVAAVPYIMIWIGYLVSGWISDRLTSSGKVSFTNMRKICAVCAMFVPAILLFCSSLFEKNVPVLILMNLAMFFQGFANSSYYVNYMDLSPRFSGVVCGLGNGVCAIFGLVGPVAVGQLLDAADPNDHVAVHKQWQLAFASASILWVIGSLQFVIFGSAEVQPWDTVEEEEEKIQDKI